MISTFIILLLAAAVIAACSGSPSSGANEITLEVSNLMAAAMGTTNSLEFTPTKPGTHEFLCTVAGHKEAGMVGTLVVKAP